MSVDRQPAIRKPAHPAAELPERPSVVSELPAKSVEATAAVIQHGVGSEEKMNEQHNVRIRQSTKARLLRAVDKLRYETGDRSISIASITDAAIVDYLENRGC